MSKNIWTTTQDHDEVMDEVVTQHHHKDHAPSKGRQFAAITMAISGVVLMGLGLAPYFGSGTSDSFRANIFDPGAQSIDLSTASNNVYNPLAVTPEPETATVVAQDNTAQATNTTAEVLFTDQATTDTVTNSVFEVLDEEPIISAYKTNPHTGGSAPLYDLGSDTTLHSAAPASQVSMNNLHAAAPSTTDSGLPLLPLLAGSAMAALVGRRFIK